ncbi:insulinase family protein [Salipiger sp. IMCC34102]|uniref:M16 family metallopeptidase n=1 Tax=Salipiger sp. IMCC34102 TaxID=2510647 RepID=UPI00101C868F|nr:pitrilysin family protein [Salipiger sp. IMCC34102]RYH03926.1 insulinase family protein [Salipiger sp. IMCC34102]
MIRYVLAFCATIAGTTAFAAVDIQEVTSDGGITAWLVEDHNIPFTALEIRIRGGASLDEEGKRGATNLMMGLLEEGAGEMDAQAFQTRREELSASYGFDTGDDMISVSAQFLTENRDEAVDLLRLALVEPRFDETAVERVRAQVLAGISRAEKSPNEIASEAFFASAFPDDPYGTPLRGTTDSVTALSRADIVTAWQNALVQDRIYVGAVGDITPEALGDVLDRLLGDLPQSGPPLPGPVDVQIDGGISVVDFPTPQSVALFGHEGMDRDDPDYFAATILNEALGAGGFESRLMDEVREKRGLTYGVSTYLVPKDRAALVLGSVASANGSIAEAVDVIRDEWARIAEEGMTQEELDRVKLFLTGAYPLRFDGNANIASILVGMQMIDLPRDYVANRNDYIEAVTLDDVNRVAAELYNPEALRFTVVGTPEGLAETP